MVSDGVGPLVFENGKLIRGGEFMAVVRILLGIVVGCGIAFASLYLILHLGLQVNNATALTVAAIGGLIGGVYSAVAFARGIYGLGPFSILGYLLDMSWSLPNTAASLLVWLPACMVAGGDFVEPDDNSRRSGTFVYRENPRGGGYDATTIGTVIAGGWCSHEEVHVWQARLFGLLYLPVYGLSLLLNLLFRLCTGKLEDLTLQAYYRVCFEDWAYSAGSASGSDIRWGGWILWFFLSLIYAGSVVLIVVGAFAGIVLLSIAAAVALVAYSLIRAFTPTTA
jgi:hypothetical protein